MGFSITTNMASLAAQRSLGGSQAGFARNAAQMASGSRINKASDDAAGLAISENLKSQIASTRQASRNANDGVSMIQVAEGGLHEIGNMIVRLRELSMQAASDQITDVDRSHIDQEIQQVKVEISRISNATTWQGQKLLDGTASFDYQVGTYNSDDADRLSFNTSKAKTSLDSLGIDGITSRSTQDAQSALMKLDQAQAKVSRTRSSFGALQNRLTSTIDNLAVAEENRSASKSRIADTDIAETQSEMTKNDILLQASTMTLAQANQVPANAVNLLR